MIPKKIHYCWISGDPYPEQIRNCVQSWKKYLPDYEFILWDANRVKKEFQSFRVSDKTDENYNKLYEGVTDGNLWLKQTITLKKYAFAADFIRIYSLLKYGGVYLDADVELVNSLDPFLSHDFFIGVEYNNDLEPAVFGAVPGHPWLKDLLKYYNGRSFIKEDGLLDIRTLPNIFNETAYLRYGFRSNGEMQYIQDEGVVIYSNDYFSPKNIHSKKIKRTINTVAIHHFESTWFQKDMKYILKQIFHQILFGLGGKSFHNQFIQFIRRVRK